jgi:hypothetical protein
MTQSKDVDDASFVYGGEEAIAVFGPRAYRLLVGGCPRFRLFGTQSPNVDDGPRP